VVEATNTAIRVYDKSTGNILLSEEIGALFGIPAFTDPYIVYDDIAQRFAFIVLTFNSSGGDAVPWLSPRIPNFLDGFLPTQIVDFGSNVLDFDKIGFNADAYVITGNLFTHPTRRYRSSLSISRPCSVETSSITCIKRPGYPDHFRAEVPAQMHGAAPGSPMYLVEEAGYGNGHAARIVR